MTNNIEHGSESWKGMIAILLVAVMVAMVAAPMVSATEIIPEPVFMGPIENIDQIPKPNTGIAEFNDANKPHASIPMNSEPERTSLWGDLTANNSEPIDRTNPVLVDKVSNYPTQNPPAEINSPPPSPTPSIVVDIFTEDFNGAFPPTGWTIVDPDVYGGWWQSNNDGYGNPSPDGTMAAYVEYEIDYPSDEWLISPSINLTGATSTRLDYDYIWDSSYAGAWSEGRVWGSTDGGATWTQNIYTFPSGNAWITGTDSWDISAWADGQTNVVFAFQYVSNDDDWFWLVDNVIVSGDVMATLKPSFQQDYGAPGTDVNYLLNVYNDDVMPQTFDITSVGNVWPVSFFAAPQQFLNPSVETGDFTAWSTSDIPNPYINLNVNGAGNTCPDMTDGFLSSPTDGIYSIQHGFDGTGPGNIKLGQDITLPAGNPQLEFDYRASWDLQMIPATLDRNFSVHVEPSGGGAPLQTTLMLTAVANTYVADTGILHGIVDLSAFAGNTQYIDFDWWIPEDHSGPAFFELDNIIINADPVTPITQIGPVNPLLSGFFYAQVSIPGGAGPGDNDLAPIFIQSQTNPLTIASAKIQTFVPMPLPFFDDFETPSGPYTISDNNMNPGTQWEWGDPSSFIGGPGSAFSGTNCWGTNLLDNYYWGADAFLTLNGVDLTSLPSATMSFWHWYQMDGWNFGEYDNEDGGWVEVSNDGGATWMQITPAGGYPEATEWDVGPFDDSYPCFASESNGWIRSEFDLTSFGGDLIDIRFRFFSESWPETGYAGWYIDDLMIIPPPAHGLNVQPDFQSGIGLPGEDLYYDLTATNKGLNIDTYDLSASGNAWPVTFWSTPYIDLFNEDFEGAFPPAGWSIFDYLGGGANWDNNLFTGTPNFAGGLGICADANNMPAPMASGLRTPTFSLVGYTSAILEFDMSYDDLDEGSGTYGIAEIWLTNDGGGTWFLLETYDEDHSVGGPGEHISIDLTTFAGEPTLNVEFYMYNDVAPIYYWQIDNVEVLVPTGVMAPITSVGPLAYDEFNHFIARVEIPIGAMPGDFDVATIRAISQGDPTVFDTATIRTQVPQSTPWLDDVEGGPGTWTGWDSGDGTIWELGNPAGGEGPSTAESPVNCWGTNLLTNYAVPSEAILTTPPLQLGFIEQRLTFDQWYEIDGSEISWDYEDGGWVEISSDRGASWNQIFPVFGYNDWTGDFVPDYGTEVECYAGISNGWIPAEFDLEAWEGQEVMFRFRFFTEQWTGEPEDYAGWYIDNIYVGEDRYQINLEPDYQINSGYWTESVDHTITAYNTGSLADNYDLTAAGNTWPVTFWNMAGTTQIFSTGNILPGASKNFIARVNIPSGAPDGTTDLTTITATSLNDPIFTWDTTQVETRAFYPWGVQLLPNLANQFGFTGHSVYYIFTVQNTGIWQDNYDLSPMGNIWPVTFWDITGTVQIFSTGNLQPGESLNFIVRVDIPIGPAPGSFDNVNIIVESQNDPAFTWDVSTIQTNGVPEYWFEAGPDTHTNFGWVGDWVEHRVQITNEGTQPDVYLPMFQQSPDPNINADWWTQFYTVDLRPQGIYNGIDDGSQTWWWGPVAPGQTKEYAIKVFVPTGQAGLFDWASISITSSNNPSQVRWVEICTRTSMSAPFYDDFEEAGNSGTFGQYDDGGFLGTVSNAWTRTNDNWVDIDDMTAYSGTYSIFTSGGVVSATSCKIDMDMPMGIASCVIQRGGGVPGSEAPDWGDDLVVEYSDGNGQWAEWHELGTFPGEGTPGEVFTPVWILPEDALQSRFQIRFRQTNGFGDGFDYWHIDDVYVGALENDFDIFQSDTPRISLFSEDFEDGDFSDWTLAGVNNDWQIGTPTGLGGDPIGAFESVYSIGNDLTGLGMFPGRYEDNVGAGTNYIYSPAIDCTGRYDVSLEFYRWLGIENQIWDNAYIYVSNDGVTWNQVWMHTGESFVDSDWEFVQYDISAYADNQATVYVRFDMGSTDPSVTYCGWNIDDVRLWADISGNVPGDSISYEIAIENFARHADEYIITVEGNTWTTWVYPTSVLAGPNGPHDTKLFNVFVNVPAGAAPGTSDSAFITVTSILDPTVSETIIITTSVATVHNLDQDVWYSSLQNAVNMANPGDNIFAYSWTYNEHVVIEKPLIIEGENKATTIVDGMYSGSPFTVRTDGVEIFGFTIQHSANSGSFYPAGAGILLDGAGDCNIHDNVFRYCQAGISSMFGSMNWIEDNEFYGNMFGHYSMNRVEDDFAMNSNFWTYEGSASLTGGYMELTPAVGGTGRTFFMNNQMDITSRFEVEFDYNIGNLGGGGADGLVFMFYKDMNYVPASGGRLGFDPDPDVPSSALGYGVEFDHWAGGGDPSDEHIGLIKDRTYNTHLSSSDADIDNGVWNHVRIVVDTTSITVYHIDMVTPIFTYNGPIDRTYGGMGFCAATGGATASHWINNFAIRSLGSPGDIFQNNIVAQGLFGTVTMCGHNNYYWGNLFAGNFYNSVMGLETAFEYAYPSTLNNHNHNDFIWHSSMAIQALDFTGLNEWSFGYPAGGNYWSDYTGVDVFSGPLQNIPGGDSLGDTPYNIIPGGQDEYPRMSRWTTYSLSGIASNMAPYSISGSSITQFNTAVTSLIATQIAIKADTAPDGDVYVPSIENVGTLIFNELVPIESPATLPTNEPFEDITLPLTVDEELSATSADTINSPITPVVNEQASVSSTPRIAYSPILIALAAIAMMVSGIFIYKRKR